MHYILHTFLKTKKSHMTTLYTETVHKKIEGYAREDKKTLSFQSVELKINVEFHLSIKCSNIPHIIFYVKVKHNSTTLLLFLNLYFIY